MKRISMIGLCLMAVLACSVVAVASASAAEENKLGLLLKLPAGSSFPVSFTSTTTGINILEPKATANKVECVNASDNGTFENAHLGKDTVIFKECTTTVLGIKVKCFGANAGEEAAGIITTHLLTHLGRTTVSGVEKDGVLILLEGGSFTFHCTSATTIVVKGEVISLLETPTNTEIVAGTEYASLHQKFTKGANAGEQAEKTFFLLLLPKPTTESGEMTNVHLTSKLNSGAEEESNQQSVVTLENFKNSTGIKINALFERG